MAVEINKYLKQHRLNVEGELSVRAKPDMFTKMSADSEELRLDDTSHFICRLAYCRNDELRRWFVTQEARLFQYRLDFYTSGNKLDFLKDKCSMKFEQLSAEHPDWMQMKEKIAFGLEAKLRQKAKARNTVMHPFRIDDHADDFIKLPFKSALSLIG